jgi:hypothetical protein
MGDRQQIGMGGGVGHAELFCAALALAQHFAGTAQAQVFLGDDKAVICFAQDLQPRLGGFAQRRVPQQDAARLAGAATDPPAQLVPPP